MQLDFPTDPKPWWIGPCEHSLNLYDEEQYFFFRNPTGPSYVWHDEFAFAFHDFIPPTGLVFLFPFFYNLRKTSIPPKL